MQTILRTVRIKQTLARSSPDHAKDCGRCIPAHTEYLKKRTTFLNRRFVILGRVAARQNRAILRTVFTLICCLACVPFQAQADVKITIEGIGGELEDNARAFLSLGKLQAPYNERRLRRLYRDANDEIKNALVPFGYYDVKVISNLEKDGGSWKANFEVDKGEQTKIRSIDIQLAGEGSENRMIELVIENKELEEGEALLHKEYETLKRGIDQAAVTRGYVRGGFSKSRIEVDTEAKAADIILHYDTGPRYFFGDITIEQNILKDNFVKGFVNLNEKTAFNTEALLNTQLTLTNTNYFKTAYADADVPSIESGRRYVPITIETEPADRFHYLASAGFGTDTGARIGLGFSDYRVNRSGHQFDSSLELSQVETNANAQYKIPFGNPQTDYYDLFLDTSNEDVNQVDRTNYSIGSSWNRALFGGLLRVALRAEREDYRFGDAEEQSAELLVPVASFLRRSADDDIFPRKGYSYSATVATGVEALFSETSFVQASGQFRWVRGFAEDYRLLYRVEGGSTWTDTFEDLPPSYRFFTGGAQTVRGYGYKNISPLNDDNITTGGEHYFASSVETDWLFKGNFGAAAFVDAGAASESVSLDPLLAAGVGFRYRSPIGMIRFDLAHPFDDADKSLRFHLSIGPDL